MAHYLYIIFSPSKKTFYVGETDDLEIRLEKHNSHAYSGSFTKIASDWEFALTKIFKEKKDAIFLEKFIKRMKSKKFIVRVIENPQILDDILKKR